MSEQTIQNDLYSYNVSILDKYECLNLGATTIRNLMNSKKIRIHNVQDNVLDKKPDVLIIDKIGDIIIYQEHKVPYKLRSYNDIQKAIEQELYVAKALKAKIYIVTDGEEFIWINPLTGEYILDENGDKLTYKIKPKENQKDLIDIINRVIISIDETNNQLLKKEFVDPTDLAQKINGILKNLTFASSKMSLYTFVEVFLFKYLSDIEILKGENSFNYICNLYNNNEMTDAIVLG